MTRAWFAAVAAVMLVGAGCGGEETGRPPSDIPTPPVLNPGMAMVSGRVIDSARQPVAGATVAVMDKALTDPAWTTTTGADGTWQLAVPGLTTVTLNVEATGFAPTWSNSFTVAKGQTSTELDLMLIPPAKVDQLSALMGGARVAEYGVAAIEVRSLSGACDPAGGTVTLQPTAFGKVFYSKATAPDPDSTLTSVQVGARPSAWLAGVLPSGAYYQLVFQKAGCTQKTGPVEYRGRRYDGELPIVTKALSHGLLFVE
jgi:hypothetical protein